MKVIRVSDVIGMINKIAPMRFAEAWDNPGLQVGDPSAKTERIMIALDACRDSVEAAIAERCTLLLTHHPLIFTPLKRVSSQDPEGALLLRAIVNGLSIVALHTNYDIAAGGVNDLLAERLGLCVTGPLKVTGSEELVKLVVYVPQGHEETVTEELFKFSSAIGNYSDCSFRVAGTGTFLPRSGSHPFIGEQGKRATVEEFRVEVLLRREDLDAAVSAMKKVHPYEEPAFDLFQLHNRGEARGLGRIGELPDETTLSAFARTVKVRLEAGSVRFVGDGIRKVRRVAVCGGSGSSLLMEAHFRGADVLVTGDVKYHDAREAEALGLAIIDAGHFATERLIVSGLATTLEREFKRLGAGIEVIPFAGELDPFSHIG